MSAEPTFREWAQLQRQTCKACGRPDKFDFSVPDELWAAVVPERLQNFVVCLACFDAFAYERNVSYGAAIRELLFVGNRASFRFAPIVVRDEVGEVFAGDLRLSAAYIDRCEDLPA